VSSVAGPSAINPCLLEACLRGASEMRSRDPAVGALGHAFTCRCRCRPLPRGLKELVGRKWSGRAVVQDLDVASRRYGAASGAAGHDLEWGLAPLVMDHRPRAGLLDVAVAPCLESKDHGS
jgi:hypothetical protein